MTTEVVLTAAHVVKDALSIHARFTADPTDKLPAEVLWTVDDLAALRVPLEGDLPPARYGLVDDHAAELPCRAIGFPAWKFRDNRRDSGQISGAILPLSNRYTGTLHVGVDRPPAEDREGSPWEGMSGAALFVGDRLVGIIAEHHLVEGPGHLTAHRADWRLTPEQCEQIGYGQVVSVNPPAGRRPRGYLARVRDLAPAEGLRDRGDELEKLTAFCRGEESYLRLRGPAWSGKTALASSFVLDPPDGVRVAAFFVFGHADADAFRQAMGEQLAAIAEVPEDAGHLDDLLEEAARRCQEIGERLLLVVDGLDEDKRPEDSIAVLLPRNPPEGVRVLVTGRPHPGIPADVPSGHPLHTCRIQELAPNAHARHLEIEAKNDFERSLKVPGNDKLLGVIAVAQGALALDDLATLTDLPRWEVRDRLSSRSFTQTADGYLYAHETLYRMAEQDLAPLDRYRAMIHSWADSYREQGWPQDTPAYLLGSYGRLLADRGRLVDYALDRARHDRMRGIVGGESAAIRELTAAQQAIGDEAEPDLLTLTRLAVTRDQLSRSASPPPVELPALWARLGWSDRAVTLARSIVDADSRASASAAVAKAMAESGELGAAATLARSIDRTEQRAWALGSVVKAMADRGELSAAETLAGSIEVTERRIWALAAMAKASRSTELLDEAERLAPSVVDLGGHAWAMAALVEAAAVCGDVARAEALVDRIPQMNQRVWALSAVLKALAGGELDRITAVRKRAEDAARTIIHERGQEWAVSALVAALACCGDVEGAEAMARGLPTPYSRSYALTVLTETIGAGGDLERAEELAAEVPIPAQRAYVLSNLAKEIARRGDTEWALELAEQAEVLTPGLTPRGRRARAMVAVAEAYGACADSRAEKVASAIKSPYYQVQALIAVAGTVPDPDRACALAEQAERLARTRTSFTQRAQTLVSVTEAVAAGGDLDRAEALAGAIPDPAIRTRVLTDLVRLIAARDVARAEFVVRERISAEDQDRALVGVAKALAAHGELDRAEELALSLSSADLRAQALALVVKEIRRMDRAVAVARKIPHADRRGQACVGLAQTMAGRGSLRRARALARTLPAADQRAHALLAVAMASEGGGDRELVKEAEKLVQQVQDEGRRTRLVTALVKAFAGIGRLGHAERLARGIRSPETRPGALADVAAAFASRGQVRRALVMVRQILASASKARAYVAVVKALSDRGDVAAALEIASNEIPTADYMAQAFTVLIKADPGRKATVTAAAKRAESLFPARITHPDQQLMAFVDLLRAIVDSAGLPATRGLADRIEGLTARVEDPDRQAQILVALSRTVEPARARRLVARVLSGPAWTAALGALREVEPRALPLVAEELLGLADIS